LEVITSLTLPLFIEVSVPSQESERSCIVRSIDLAYVSTIFLLDFGNVVTVWYFLLYILFV